MTVCIGEARQPNYCLSKVKEIPTQTQKAGPPQIPDPAGSVSG